MHLKIGQIYRPPTHSACYDRLKAWLAPHRDDQSPFLAEAIETLRGVIADNIDGSQRWDY